MRAWWAKVSEFFRTWQNARHQVKQAKWSQQEQRQAEELQRAREGVDRFPLGGGGL